jgi:ATP-dependent DNA helicase RecG
MLESFFESLPFDLTGAQYRVLEEMFADIRSTKPMRRMLQGDVGSGKTVVAAAAMLAAVQNDLQSALMAPTEILAEQHFLTICNLLSETELEADGKYVATLQVAGMEESVVVALLLGSHRKRIKDDIYAMLAAGAIDVIIGTHALIQNPVEIPNLALVVVDEQHRFGVMQRASLSEKGARPHVLAMSATPIPRSLALTVYGDLDVSVIDEMPPGRESIRTRWVESDRRDAAYGFVRKEVEAGRQAFIVCPLIEESEAIQSRAAVVEHERLSTQVFPDLNLGLLHGRMSLQEKEEVMDRFKTRDVDILVSTPVIEVGIDVPNATVMLIDGADRFGLSQLHQFRGRVGRGEHQSYCLLMADSPGMEARKRLKLLERVRDGFQLAEEDLKLRGPGDYAGTRQSGLPSLKVASIMDQDILALARREAIRLLETDPDLTSEYNTSLGELVRKFSGGLTADMS